LSYPNFWPKISLSHALWPRIFFDFSKKISTESYFKITHFGSFSDPLFILFLVFLFVLLLILFLVFIYFIFTFYFIFILISHFDRSKNSKRKSVQRGPKKFLSRHHLWPSFKCQLSHYSFKIHHSIPIKIH